ncbi:hypothetical protein GHT09_014732 [Marmota monax]|uniref:Uncharacterized protein n=1 Tax=Marmota monax TaxID=9995 RepID=A0A834QBX0_MARMO|nr:hypothetical protein GHT09_014732 [Marmota monax]
MASGACPRRDPGPRAPEEGPGKIRNRNLHEEPGAVAGCHLRSAPRARLAPPGRARATYR